MVRVLLFSQVALRAGTGVCEWPVVGPQSAQAFWEWLLLDHPSLSGMREFCRLARNGEYVGEGECFVAGDELAVIPPVSGG